MGLPEAFIPPAVAPGTNYIVPAVPLDGETRIMKPVFGTIGQQFVRFFIEYRYNAVKSAQLNYEFKEPIEMCEIVNDRFTKFHIPVAKLQPWQKRLFADLYDRFRKQENSLDTAVMEWVAVSPSEKAMLESRGFSTVEQLATASQEIIARLGLGGAELQERAKKHVNTKTGNTDVGSALDEVNKLRHELEEERKRNNQKMEEWFKAQEAKAEAEKTLKYKSAAERMARARAARKAKSSSNEETKNEENTVSNS